MTQPTNEVSVALAERDRAIARAQAAEARERKANDQLLEAHLDSLVGVKFLPCERDSMAQLARTNRPLFNKLVAARPDLGLLGPRKAVDRNQTARDDLNPPLDGSVRDPLTVAAE